MSPGVLASITARRKLPLAELGRLWVKQTWCVCVCVLVRAGGGGQVFVIVGLDLQELC